MTFSSMKQRNGALDLRSGAAPRAGAARPLVAAFVFLLLLYPSSLQFKNLGFCS